MEQRQNNPANTARRDEKPWYKQFWPWFIIALPLTAVLASFNLLWLAINNPDVSVLDESEYRALKSELKAQPVPDAEVQEIETRETETGEAAVQGIEELETATRETGFQDTERQEQSGKSGSQTTP